MKNRKHIESLNVMFNDKKVGTLALGERQKIHFAYDEEWLKMGFNISPFDLEWNNKWQSAKGDIFGGLHGIFADSISDGWGLLLTDRAIQHRFGWTKSSITPMDRLFFMGNRSMGGLNYKPYEKEKEKEALLDLSDLWQETQKIVSGEKEEIIPSLYLSGGSPGGARPKALFSKKGECFMAGYDTIPEGSEAWMIKFFGEKDPDSMGKIEMAYSEMARDCGIFMPKTELIEVMLGGKKYSFFAIQRFDRDDKGQKIHTASLSGLIYASHRLPSVSYKDIMNVTQKLTQSKKELKRVMEQMVFNVLAHNQDDHSKNWTYRYVNDHWELSPAYDLVFSTGIGFEQMCDVLGSGNPTAVQMIELGKSFMLKETELQIEKTIDVVKRWREYSDRFQIEKKTMLEIDKSIKQKIDSTQLKMKKKKSG